ncbi:uncharacterized protein [Penaeus vannamei]|uniref:uncharacterized protein n=1 Tax=Penaeus vannamei TaxID=6689 RepID=UPI000F672BF4|nr:glycine, alanine and asparagine-rich protein-like [Penaeus vannamei]
MQLSRAAGLGALLLVALPSVLGPADATLLLPLTAVSLGTGALATLGLLGAVGLGVAIKKTLYYGGRGHGHDHHYHSHHHDHTGGGYGGAHTGGGYGGAHTGGGYGGYGGGYPSPSYAAPLASAYRRRRSSPTLAENDRAAVDALVSDDRLGCAQRLVCELAREPEDDLQADEAAILALVSDERAPAGVKQMRGAAAAGKGGAGCSSLFKNCPFSARDIMAVVRAAAEENA